MFPLSLSPRNIIDSNKVSALVDCNDHIYQFYTSLFKYIPTNLIEIFVNGVRDISKKQILLYLFPSIKGNFYDVNFSLKATLRDVKSKLTRDKSPDTRMKMNMNAHTILYIGEETKMEVEQELPDN